MGFNAEKESPCVKNITRKGLKFNSISTISINKHHQPFSVNRIE